jgi:hypothetical protein
MHAIAHDKKTFIYDTFSQGQKKGQGQVENKGRLLFQKQTKITKC